MQLQRWMAEAGLRTWVDAMGNVHGRADGTIGADAPVLLVGSHYDTVHDAGKFDGALGIIVGVAPRRPCLARLVASAFQARGMHMSRQPLVCTHGMIGACPVVTTVESMPRSPNKHAITKGTQFCLDVTHVAARVLASGCGTARVDSTCGVGSGLLGLFHISVRWPVFEGGAVSFRHCGGEDSGNRGGPGLWEAAAGGSGGGSGAGNQPTGGPGAAGRHHRAPPSGGDHRFLRRGGPQVGPNPIPRNPVWGKPPPVHISAAVAKLVHRVHMADPCFIGDEPGALVPGGSLKLKHRMGPNCTPCRFGTTFLGSRAVSGSLVKSGLLSVKELGGQGATLAEALASQGFDSSPASIAAIAMRAGSIRGRAPFHRHLGSSPISS